MNGQAVDDIARGLGQDWDIVTDMAIKLMPGAHPFHATAEAAADAARAGNVQPQDIERVTISAAVQWTNFKGEPHPRNLVDAAHSLVYFVAASIVDGEFGWDAMTLAKMTDPVIARVQDKVVFDPDPAPLPDRFPHRHGGSVSILLKDGRVFSSTCVAPRGSGPRGVRWDDVDAKYRRLVPMAGLSAGQVEGSLALLHCLEEQASIDALVGVLMQEVAATAQK
jgi:2-methylcitrate dehydratase PrpD